MAFFTLSKAHLTLIGVGNGIEVLATATYSITTFLFLLRYFQSDKRLNYWIAVFSFALCVFARDASVAFFGVVFVSVAANAWQLRGLAHKRVAIRAFVLLLPFAAIVVGYAVVRYAIVGMPPVGGENYSLHLSLSHILVGLYHFVGNISNVAVDLPHVVGSGDLSTVATKSQTIHQIYRSTLILAVCLAFVVTAILSLRRDLSPLVPLSWAGALLLPALLVGTLHIHYMFEPIIGLSLFLAAGISQIREHRMLQLAMWSPLIVLAGLNTVISNAHADNYWWGLATRDAKRLNDQIYDRHRGKPIKNLTLVVDDRAAAEYYRWLIDPIGAKGRVQSLNILMSPTVENFRAVPFDEFSLQEFPKRSDELVYRASAKDKRYVELAGRPAEIASVEADSSLDAAHDASKLVDGDSQEAMSWASLPEPGDHKVTVTFTRDVPLGSIRVINPPDRRIGALEVRVLAKGGWKPVFKGRHLETTPVINIRWRDRQASAVQLLLKENFRDGQRSPGAGIAEVEFPENRLSGPLAGSRPEKEGRP